MSKDAIAAQGPLDRGVMPHTPGPWRWVGDNLESLAPEANYADVLTVEQLPHNAYPELQSGELVIENDADRALIAAAPELLDAAEKALALLRRGTAGWGVAKDLLNAAIHKARGHEA